MPDYFIIRGNKHFKQFQASTANVVMLMFSPKKKTIYIQTVPTNRSEKKTTTGDVETSAKKRKLHFTRCVHTKFHKIQFVSMLKENIFTSNFLSKELNYIRKYCFDGY